MEGNNWSRLHRRLFYSFPGNPTILPQDCKAESPKFALRGRWRKARSGLGLSLFPNCRQEPSLQRRRVRQSVLFHISSETRLGSCIIHRTSKIRFEITCISFQSVTGTAWARRSVPKILLAGILTVEVFQDQSRHTVFGSADLARTKKSPFQHPRL